MKGQAEQYEQTCLHRCFNAKCALWTDVGIINELASRYTLPLRKQTTFDTMKYIYIYIR